MIKERQRCRFTVSLLILALGAVSVWLAADNHRLRTHRTEAGDQATTQLFAAVPREETGLDLLSPPEARALRAAGLSEPAADLRADLMRRADLIPVEPVLGGAMGFYDPAQIHILGDRWVVAGFEDGHIAGKLLLRYRVERGTIHWDVLDVTRF